MSILLRFFKKISQPALLALLFVLMIFFSIFVYFDPCWETNDDIAMSMVSHGYGIANYGSPYLIFSNILWGYIVRTIPVVNGMLGYSVATIAALLLASWVSFYFLLRLGVGFTVSLLAVVLVVSRPMLFPQFTIIAGLLTVSAIIGWNLHARQGGYGSLIVSCLLAFFGYLIRSQEFFLILIVSLPFMPWREMREQRPFQLGLCLLLVSIVFASLVDRRAYSGDDWRRFSELNRARAPFTDFGADIHLKRNAEIIARYGYSQNDIDLLRKWFFVDSLLTDPDILNRMLAELGPIALQDNSPQSALLAVKTLLNNKLLPLFLCGIALLLLLRKRTLIFSWLIFVLTLFAMGVAGRPGVIHVYLAPLGFLCLAPLVAGGVKRSSNYGMVSLVFLIACASNAYFLINEGLQSKKSIQQVQEELASLPLGTIVSWGDGFPFEYAFPLLVKDSVSRGIRLYALGVFTLAPFSVAVAEEKSGRHMIERLQSSDGLPVIAGEREINLLRNYCHERLKGELHALHSQKAQYVSFWQVRCDVGD